MRSATSSKYALILISLLSKTGTWRYIGFDPSNNDNGVSGNSGAAFITQVMPSFSKNTGIATPAPHKYNDGKISDIPGNRMRGFKLFKKK